MAEEDLGGENQEEIRADLTKSSLAIHGGLIRLPSDNFRLVCDSLLQAGILSIETRDVGGEAKPWGTRITATRIDMGIYMLVA